MLKFIITSILVSFFSLLLKTGHSKAIENRETQLTIYTQNLGVVNEKRKTLLSEGISTLEFANIPTQIIPNSIIINFEGDVFQQSLNLEVANLPYFLEKSIDSAIYAVSLQNQMIKGKLLYYSENSFAIETNEGNIILAPDIKDYTIYFPIKLSSIPLKPSISWLVKPKKAGPNIIHWTYQTAGISWEANFNAILDEKENKMTLQCWANITNNSGASFDSADVKLFSGSINLVAPREFTRPMLLKQSDELSMGTAPITIENLSEYYTFNVPLKVSIKDKESKLIKLFEANNIAIQKTYTVSIPDYYNYQNTKDNPNIKISFKNIEKNNLGYSLPKGLANFYKSNNNRLELIGQSYVPYVPKNEDFRAYIGKAFDIVTETQVVESQRISDKIIQKTFKFIVRNHKKENVTVELIFSATGFPELIKSSIKPSSTQANTFTFEIPANSNDSSELIFTVRITD